MAKDNIDIMLDANGDDAVVNGDFAIGDGTLDDCTVIFKLNTGALKSDPVIGPNIIMMMNSNTSPTEIKRSINLSLSRDGKTPKRLDIVSGKIKFEI